MFKFNRGRGVRKLYNSVSGCTAKSNLSRRNLQQHLWQSLILGAGASKTSAKLPEILYALIPSTEGRWRRVSFSFDTIFFHHGITY